MNNIKIRMIDKYILLVWFYFMLFLGCREHSPQDQSLHTKNEIQEDNQIDSCMIKLGHFLFFENNLSLNGSKSCASCHHPNFAFTDSYRRSFGMLTERTLRNSPGLINIAENKYFSYSDTAITSLESQILHPLFSTTPVEIGAIRTDLTIPKKILSDTTYQRFISECTLKWDENNFWDMVINSISSYVKTLNSYHSKYDQFLAQKNDSLLSNDELEGMRIFYSDKTNCGKCHSGINFTINSDASSSWQDVFRNNGLYPPLAVTQKAQLDEGMTLHTRNDKDRMRFKIPSLRNLLFTAPYYHDGSAESLLEVIDNYAAGGNREYVNNHYKSIEKDPLINGFELSEEDKRKLISFLYTLTDSSILENKKFQSPHAENNQKY